VGDYTLGTGFLGVGVLVVSDLNFHRLFPHQTPDEVNVGLVRLRTGSDPNDVARRLREILPNDTRVHTRAEFAQHEIDHWVTATSTGLVFGFGVLVAVIVGAAILFQSLSSLIAKNIPAFATLKAIGYTDRYLAGIVVVQAILISLAAYLPAVLSSFGLYDATREATLLPVFMTTERIAVVLIATVATAVVSALITVRVLKRADPVDLF
jgi:putative ABC transport system permease protein